MRYPKYITLILFFVPVNCMALTLSDIRTDVRTIVNDSLSTRNRFTNTQLNYWINEGQRLADVKTRCNQKTYSFDLAAGTTFYQMPDDFIYVERLTRGRLYIQELTPAGLDGRSSMWETAGGLPTYYFVNFSSRSQVGFFPFPDTANSTETIKVDYVSYSTTLTSDSQIPFDTYKDLYGFHDLLTYYAAYKACMIDERYAKAKAYLETFTVLVDQMKTSCKDRPNYKPSLIGKQ